MIRESSGETAEKRTTLSVLSMKLAQEMSKAGERRVCYTVAFITLL
jgi:hypothetical protein